MIYYNLDPSYKLEIVIHKALKQCFVNKNHRFATCYMLYRPKWINIARAANIINTRYSKCGLRMRNVYV